MCLCVFLLFPLLLDLLLLLLLLLSTPLLLLLLSFALFSVEDHSHRRRSSHHRPDEDRPPALLLFVLIRSGGGGGGGRVAEEACPLPLITIDSIRSNGCRRKGCGGGLSIVGDDSSIDRRRSTWGENDRQIKVGQSRGGWREIGKVTR